jgi:hypothetical protein
MKRKPHVFSWWIKHISRSACAYCGLVKLRNALTDRAIAEGCKARDDG